MGGEEAGVGAGSRAASGSWARGAGRPRGLRSALGAGRVGRSGSPAYLLLVPPAPRLRRVLGASGAAAQSRPLSQRFPAEQDVAPAAAGRGRRRLSPGSSRLPRALPAPGPHPSVGAATSASGVGWRATRLAQHPRQVPARPRSPRTLLWEALPGVPDAHQPATLCSPPDTCQGRASQKQPQVRALALASCPLFTIPVTLAFNSFQCFGGTPSVEHPEHFVKLLVKTAKPPSQRPRCAESLGGLGCGVLSIQCCADCYSFQSGPVRIFPLYEKEPGYISNRKI